MEAYWLGRYVGREWRSDSGDLVYPCQFEIEALVAEGVSGVGGVVGASGLGQGVVIVAPVEAGEVEADGVDVR